MLSEVATELFASGGARRRLAKKWITQQLGDDRSYHAAARGELAIAVKGKSEELRGDGVDDHVARAGIEGDHLLRARAGRKSGEVGDASEVLQNAPAARMAEEEV